MSHGNLREQHNCLNCGHIVEERFCTRCGQENTETRQPFHYLFTHFIEDFTHYDGQFWKTIKALFLEPGKLTQIYLQGKRQYYVPPVKLYIFVSFVTFFLSAILPSNDVKDHIKITPKSDTKISSEKIIEKYKKNGATTFSFGTNAPSQDENNVEIDEIKTIDEYDKKHTGVFASLARPFVKKYIDLKNEGKSMYDIKDKFLTTFMHSLPKALFLYLPLFAFTLWFFHNKKEWFYFDHGVFTLHYFSFLLATITVMMLSNTIHDYTDNVFANFIHTLVNFGIIIYWPIYFLTAHKRIYQQKNSATLIKGIILFIINSLFLAVLMLGLAAFSFLILH